MYELSVILVDRSFLAVLFEHMLESHINFAFRSTSVLESHDAELFLEPSASDRHFVACG